MKKLALIYIILAGVLWGTSGIFVHFLAPYGVTSIQMTFIRALVSVLCVLIFALIRDRSILKATPKQLLLYLLSGVSFFATASCYYFSMQATSISTAVVLMYLAPIFVMIYSVAFLGEKLTALKTVSVVAMLVGCGLVSGIIGGLKFDPMGIIFGILSGIAYASYNIVTKIEMRKGCNPISATLYCFVFATLVGLFSCRPSGLSGCVLQNPPVVILLMLGLGIFTCILPYLFYTLAMKVLPAGTTSSLGIIEPMAATVYSVVFFKEVLSVSSFCGIILIITAVFMLSKNNE